MQQVQLYDDRLDFEDNKARGPFGDYTDSDQAYINQGEPTYDFFGQAVYSPFGIGAGPLPTTSFIKAGLSKGFDIVTLKSVRTDVFPLNPYPQVRPVKITGDLDPNLSLQVASKYSNPLAVANSFGIPSVAPGEWQNYIKQSLSLPGKGQALMVAFQGTARGRGRDDFVNDHVKGVDLIRQTGFKGVIEINLSCPNEGEALLACFDTDVTTRIAQAVRAANSDLKFIIKLAYFVDQAQLKDLLSKVGNIVDGISAVNTIPVPVLSEAGESIFPGRAVAGISGAPIKWAGLKMTKLLKDYRTQLGMDYNIISLGGVLSAKDYKDYRQAGADTVMSVSGAIWNPNLAAEVKQSI
jgi:dihydroorotate dehydrogenase (NAD+) catalytic subunit